MKDLVQELRELGNEPGGLSTLCTGLRRVATGEECAGALSGCTKCNIETIKALADRIEAEYDPKPEPDTVEKVAKDMAAYLSKAMRGEDLYASEMTALVRRAEALGVTFDD